MENNLPQEFNKGIIFELFDKLRSGEFFDNKIKGEFKNKLEFILQEEDQKNIIKHLKETSFKVLSYRISRLLKSEKKFADLEYHNRVNDLQKITHDIFANFNSDFLLSFTHNQINFLENIGKLKGQIEELKEKKIQDELKKQLIKNLEKNIQDIIKSNTGMYDRIIENMQNRFTNVISILASEEFEETKH